MNLTKSKLKQIIKEEKQMKITKSKLKKIIKEEYSRVLRESDSPFEKYSIDTMSDGTMWAELIDEPLDYQGQLPSARIADLGDGATSSITLQDERISNAMCYANLKIYFSEI